MNNWPLETCLTQYLYAQIEKEALAETWACERSSNYIIGKQIIIETDHTTLSLVPLLTSHTLDKLPPRLQRSKLRLMRLNIKDDTKLHYTADTLSRQISKGSTEPTIEGSEIHAYISSVIAALPASDPKLYEIRHAQDEDKICKEVKK